MILEINLDDVRISRNKIDNMRSDAQKAADELWSGRLDFTGWVNHPHSFCEENVDEIVEAANDIRSRCDCFIVLGVGGSFMGAKAVIDILRPHDADTEVIFAGYNFSARYLNEVIRYVKEKEICLCVISKSGSTTETLAAYGIFKEVMLKKYGRAETAARTFVITERRSNFLADEADKEGIKRFDLDADIGGRYSVFTPVGLLPIAAAGIDIYKMMEGVKCIANRGEFSGNTLDYAIARQIHAGEGKIVEVFEFFDPYFTYFGEWLKQLFGETEGKNGIGIFPTSLIFSRDLHSMGQFLQEGRQCFFETFVTVDKIDTDIAIPQGAKPPLGGKGIEEINLCAQKGVMDAHANAGIPLISIRLPELDERSVGELMYFFEVQCAISAILSGVNPFNQPGVEAYKKEMRSYIEAL